MVLKGSFGNLLSGSGYRKRCRLCMNFTVVGETWKATGQRNSRVNIKSSHCMLWRNMERCLAQRILNLGCRYKWVVNFTFRALYSRAKMPRYPWNRRFIGTQNRPGLLEDKKTPSFLPGIEHVSAVFALTAYVTIPSEISRPKFKVLATRVGTLIVAIIYLQLIQNRYMFRSVTVLQCSHQHCVQPVASDVEVVGYL